MTKPARIAIYVTFAAAVSAGAFWAWREFLAHTPHPDREPLTEYAPSPSHALELENFLPQNANMLISLRNFKQFREQFSGTNFSQLISSYAHTAENQALAEMNIPPFTDEPSGSGSFWDLFSQNFVIAGYAAKPSQGARSAGLNFRLPIPISPGIISASVAIAKIPDPQNFKLSGMMLAAMPNSTDELYRGTAIRQTSFGYCARVIKNKDELLVYCTSLELAKSALDLILSTAPAQPSLAQENWVKEAIQKVPKESFYFQLMHDKELAQSAKTIPLLRILSTEWSAYSLTADHGLKLTSFSQWSDSMDSSARTNFEKGPAGYRVERAVPSNAIFSLSINTLDVLLVWNQLKILLIDKKMNVPLGEQLAKIDWNQIADVVGDEISVIFAGLEKGPKQWSADVRCVLQIQAPFKVQLGLRKLLENVAERIGNSAVTVEKLDKFGNVYKLSINKENAPIPEVWVTHRKRLLYAALSKNGLSELLARSADKHQQERIALPDDLRKSNILGTLNYSGLIQQAQKVLVTELSGSNPMVSAFIKPDDIGKYFAPFSAIGTAWFVTVHKKNGVLSEMNIPFTDFSKEAWNTNLSVYQPLLKLAMTQTAKQKVSTISKSRLEEIRQGVSDYRKKFRKYPRNLAALVPGILKALPKDPYTNSGKVTARYNGTGGWVYDSRKGKVDLNYSLLAKRFGLSRSGRPTSLAGMNNGRTSIDDHESKTRDNLGQLRSAITIYMSDREGAVPQSIQGMVPMYISNVPFTHLKHHPDTNLVFQVLSDKGGWHYSPADGKVTVNCSHTDSQGIPIWNW